LALALVFAPAGHALADDALVRELESLRNALPAGDPARQTLTLREADTLFDDVGEITRKPELSEAEEKKVLSARKQALKLYRETLDGAGGAYAPVSGRLKIKVQFQMARLSADLGLAEAMPLWQALLGQQELPEIRREAALRLAEAAESRQDHAASERLYTQAIALCAGGDSCSYGH
jgi:hypothetical protein